MSRWIKCQGSAAKFTEAEMREAFEAVQSSNWKDPIEAVIDAESICVTAAAIEFFAGSEVFLRAREGEDHKFDLKAPGYYARIGA